MATKVIAVSGNANQAIANDDFEGFVREANKADLLEKGFTAKEAPAVAEPEKKEESLKPEVKVETKPNRLGYKDLRDRVKELEAENVRLKAPKTEEVKVESEEKQPEKLRARPKSDDQADGKPKYKDWTEYEDDLLEWNKEKIFRELDERNAKLTREQQIEATNKTIEQSWKERVSKSREVHEDFDEIALADDGPGKLIQPGSWVDEWVMDSENGAELLYYFGQHPEELLKFQDVDKNFGGTPTTRRAAARRALVRLEDKIVAAIEKQKPDAKASSEEEPAKKAADEVRVTKTPKPSSEVGGRGNSLPDPIAAAIADGSDAATARYIEEQNRRDIRARFGDTRR